MTPEDFEACPILLTALKNINLNGCRITTNIIEKWPRAMFADIKMKFQTAACTEKFMIIISVVFENLKKHAAEIKTLGDKKISDAIII